MTPLHVRSPTVGPQLTFSPSPFLTPDAHATLQPGSSQEEQKFPEGRVCSSVHLP